MTYSRCSFCGGTQTAQGLVCPCLKSPTPGWSPTGLTLGQLSRMANIERALQGDPGLPKEHRRQILTDLQMKVDAAYRRLVMED
jgi:hypothetical protein